MSGGILIMVAAMSVSGGDLKLVELTKKAGANPTALYPVDQIESIVDDGAGGVDVKMAQEASMSRWRQEASH